ncbi:MAG: SGNH/GDSL hydrolase family protein [Planctomycetota bacterium]
MMSGSDVGDAGGFRWSPGFDRKSSKGAEAFIVCLLILSVVVCPALTVGAEDDLWDTEEESVFVATESVVAEEDSIETDPVPVQPFEYYLITFRAETEGNPMWAAAFRDTEGEALVYDVYDNVFFDPDDPSRTQSTVVRGHPDAEEMFLRFHAGEEEATTIQDLRIQRISREEARIRVDKIAANLPFVDYVPPRDRWEFIPRTIEALRGGDELRIVMLGDSICNDTSNGLFELHLMDEWSADPRIEVITSIKGSTGCTWYKEENRIDDYALQYDPDLVVIGGISHSYDVASIRSVVEQIRDASDAEVMVLTGKITPHETVHSRHFWRVEKMKEAEDPDPQKIRELTAKLLRKAESFPQDLRQMCEENDVELFDIRSAWDDYMTESWLSRDRIMRDSVHGNRFGKQIASRLLYRYLSPKTQE